MSEFVLPKRFLFRFAAPCCYREPLWPVRNTGLEARYRLVCLAEIEGRPSPVEVRAAWSQEGLAFTVCVTGKRQAPWCCGSRPEDSDGIQFWIDTRDVHNVHRASRFCHRFLFLPGENARLFREESALWLPIHRAREQPQAIQPGQLQVRSRRLPDGYQLDALISASALTGFDPQEHPRLGFTYALQDRELGEHTFGPGSPLPYQEDPSLWATLELVR